MTNISTAADLLKQGAGEFLLVSQIHTAESQRACASRGAVQYLDSALNGGVLVTLLLLWLHKTVQDAVL